MQYRVSGPDRGEGARDRARARPASSRTTRKPSTSTSTGSSRRGRCASASTRTRRACWVSARRHWPAFSTPSYRARPVTQVRDDIYLVDVVARATDEQRVSLDTLRTLQVPLPSGRTVPLSQFATFEYEQEYPAGLAARPRSDPDGAGRRRRRASLPETVVIALCAGGRGPGQDASRGLPHRCRRHGRGERRSRRPPSSPSCR